jgi:hypothetical protein
MSVQKTGAVATIGFLFRKGVTRMKVCPKMQAVIEQLATKHRVALTEPGAHLRLDMPGFDRLCIERIGRQRISVAHFFETQGYLLPEPDVVFFVDSHDEWMPIDITQSVSGWRTYVELSEDATHILRSDKAGQATLAAFCETWAQNLREQGWLEHGVKHEQPDRLKLPKGKHPLFPLGQVVATPGALEALEQAGQTAEAFLVRHVTGDWGDLDAQDVQENQAALARGGRLLSAYHLKDGTKLWLITEWDRSVTTVLLPVSIKIRKELYP